MVYTNAAASSSYNRSNDIEMKIRTTLERYQNGVATVKVNVDLTQIPSGAVGQNTPGHSDFSHPHIAPPRLPLSELVMELQVQDINIQSTQMTGKIKDLKNREKEQKSLHDDNIKKLKEIEKKMKKQEKTGKIAKIFGWIATGLALIASAIIAVATFGAGSYLVAGAVMMGAAIAVTTQTLTATGEMQKMTTELAKDLEADLKADGVSAKEAKKISGPLASAIITGVVLVAQIGCAAASAGSGAAGTVATTVVSKAMTITVKAANTGAVLSTVAGSSANVASSVYKYQASMAQAGSTKNDASLQEMTYLISADQATLQLIQDYVTSSYDHVSGLLKAQHESSMRILQATATA